MQDFKPFSIDPRDKREAPANAEPPPPSRDIDDLPISDWDEYKSWCEKVRENWDIN